MLVAFIAVEIKGPPISSLKELERSKYKLAIPKDTSTDNVFLHALYGSDEDKLQKGQNILRFNKSMEDIIDEVISKEHNTPSMIFFDVYQILKFSKHFPCMVSDIPHYQHSKSSQGMIFKKNWPFTELFNYYLLIMKEKGIMDRFFQPYIKSTEETCPEYQRMRPILKAPKAVENHTVFFLYLILSTGVVRVTIFLVIAKLLFKNAINSQ